MTAKRIRSFTVEAARLDLYVSDCASCGVIFGIPTDLEQRRRSDRQAFYCPNGHHLVFSGATPAEKDAAAAKKRADRLYASLQAARDQEEAARREAAEAKASEIRLRWRIGNGVCPCCSRTFPGLAAHVATKHPDFVHEDLAALSERMRQLLATVRRRTEETDKAVVVAAEIGAHMGTVRALVNRGLLAMVGYEQVALTEAGWPIAEQAMVICESAGRAR